MLNNLSLKNFKCFEQLDLTLAPLTILAGTNASGKSTVLQSIALMAQYAIESMDSVVPLNGGMLSLGTARDVISVRAGKKPLSIKLNTKSFIFDNVDRANTSFELKDPTDSSRILKAIKKATYISADRLGPREAHSTDGSPLYDNVGSHGERTVWYLLKYGENAVNEKLVIKNSPNTLLRQVEARMAQFFPGFHMKPLQIENANLATLSLTTSEEIGFIRPQNLGFGLSYTLPIFTACLSDDMLLIENPEAHLHPKAQSMMGQFLAEIATSGKQAIIETHSDHLLNGVRIAIKNGILSSDNVLVYFFDDNKVHEIKINDKGKLSSRPKSFFDQFELDLDELI